MEDYSRLNLSFQKSVCQEDKKKPLRSFYRQKTSRLSPALKKKKSAQIISFLNKLPFWKEASLIAAYQALNDEPDLSLFCHFWKDKIIFPVIEGEVLGFYKSVGKWRKNHLKILEPLADPKNKIPFKDISVFLIPGQVFDRNGGRLGRGKGYYDRTLAGINTIKKTFPAEAQFSDSLKLPFLKKPWVIGIAFSEQVHKDPLPLLFHDICLDLLITDRFVLMPIKTKGHKLFKHIGPGDLKK